MRWIATLALLCACTRDSDERGIQAEVTILSEHEGQLAEDAALRLAKQYGRRAIPSIETALHTARPTGRLNCIMALRRIGDADAVPLLRHFAIHDEEAGVRGEAEHTLRQWAAGHDARANAARQAVRAIDEAHGAQEKG